MGFSVEIQNKIEEMASMLFLPDDIARILEVDSSDFKNMLKDTNSSAYKAFYRGLYKRELEIRNTNKNPVDVESSEFDNQQLKDFKSHLIISLESN